MVSLHSPLSPRSRALLLTRLYCVSMTTTDQCQPPPLPLSSFPFASPAGNYRPTSQTQAEFNASSPLLTHPLSSICLRGICTFVPSPPSHSPSIHTHRLFLSFDQGGQHHPEPTLLDRLHSLRWVLTCQCRLHQRRLEGQLCWAGTVLRSDEGCVFGGEGGWREVRRG